MGVRSRATRFHAVALHAPLGPQLFGAKATHLSYMGPQRHPLQALGPKLREELHEELLQSIAHPNALGKALHCAIELTFS